MMDFVAIISLIATCIGAYFAKKAADSTKEISFPKKNPRQAYKIIKNFSKESRDFESFIARNIDRKVYINVYFDGLDFHDHVNFTSSEGWGYILIKTIPDDATEKERLKWGADHFLLHIINADSDAYLGWSTGDYVLKGYFCVVGYDGPNQGGTGAVLRPVNINT